MKHSEALLSYLLNENRLNGFTDHEIGDDHLYTGLETPLRNDTFDTWEAKKREDLAKFLSSDKASLITEQIFNLDCRIVSVKI